MSEYWKSTPKIWCKHCKTFIKDTKLEKANHEVTGKHQGNLQRFLRDLHKTNEREVREKQRAKFEVERLNGAVKKPVTGPEAEQTVVPSSGSTEQATPADRKRQMQQLAEMGIAVPEEFRREAALAGDWQTTSQRFIHDAVPKAEAGVKEEPEDSKLALNIGVRKRKHEGDDDGEITPETVVRRGWGSTTRAYPGIEGNDLDALLEKTKGPTERDANSSLKDSSRAETSSDAMVKSEDRSPTAIGPEIGPSTSNNASSLTGEDKPAVGTEGSRGTGVVFKKRKAKAPTSK
ncbi:uncharacterized protein KY384_009221 [Bacidia gigantensis]|uniref:uncharacterized protein n=1 Tax=Bacidia gigantensis TaxID=2732470 RepID=UPI001D036F29|nr:uncharacterized protein KY384_009221 [Bacidia gigantensis]KAG8525577.1 hypothetical protein KY384_009221 [Bacidia gigantensis]